MLSFPFISILVLCVSLCRACHFWAMSTAGIHVTGHWERKASTSPTTFQVLHGHRKRVNDNIRNKEEEKRHVKERKTNTTNHLKTSAEQQCLFWNSDPKMTFSKTLCKLFCIMTTGMQSMSWHISAGKKPQWHVAIDTEVSIQLLLYSCPVLCEKSTGHPPDL